MLFAVGVTGVWVERAVAQAPGQVTCKIDQRRPSDAEVALHDRKYADAEGLYSKVLATDPNSADAMAGLVRATLGEGKRQDALALAQKYDAAHPNTPALLDALGEVRFRRGEVNEAASVFNTAFKLDPCNGVTHYDMYLFFDLSGSHAAAQKRLEIAHTMSPLNPEITERWQRSHAAPMTPPEQIASLKKKLEDSTLTQDKKDGIAEAIKGIETEEKGDCRLVTPVTEAKFPMQPISYGANYTPQNMYAVGLDVELNGKKKRLEIDTGASGLLITRAAAKSAGLVPELETREGGIGDQGMAQAYVTHVDDIKIGNMEFKNCQLGVLERDSDLMENTDGLIGPDVFRDYVVTLDIPMREVRLGPLPKRPDEAAAKPASLNTSSDSGAIASIAERAKDRYIAPEMKDWTPIFRSNHFLIFPTVIGKAPVKLFVMDTGASSGMITPEAAREVTKVSADASTRIYGVSGNVKKVLIADFVQITFASVSQLVQGMSTYDNESLSDASGVEISGLIGFPTLRELIISIDYRDNLVHVVYDPKHGYHVQRPD